MPDYVIHSIAALLMFFAYNTLVEWPVVAVCAHWYCWELAQRIAKDELRQGVLYWWDIRRWSSHARSEALAPIGVCIITYATMRAING